MLLPLILFSALVSSNGYPHASASFSSECGGFMFLGEYSTPTCHQFDVLWRAVRSLVTPLQGSNGYSLRAFGVSGSWLPLNMENKYDFLSELNSWIEMYGNDVCDISAEGVNYTE